MPNANYMLLRDMTCFTLFKAYRDGNINVLMQKECLKCHKITWDLNVHIAQAKQYYCDIRNGLMVLLEVLREWSWQAQLQILEDLDVQRISDNEVGISKGNRTMLWIWYSVHLSDVPGSVEECLRIEWCKAYAWAHQCTLSGGTLVKGGKGVPAYAKCQASIQEVIWQSFERKWICFWYCEIVWPGVGLGQGQADFADPNSGPQWKNSTLLTPNPDPQVWG
ncbi:hypothetical protein EDD18DRAFT_1100698 [Armillaria luteobubalina]|uniref:Uncharacterized protein n=1 Tax=Armillaria luteobubalina TaxID=153913 RepID=A0AA39QID9_9AGAR|nr:hypothetical protein EDD18DRAFT_1100698 [Armillaria luteobubalina]